MATRQETSQQKRALIRQLRDKCRAGHYAPGVPMPSLRELSGEFGIGKDIIAQSLRELVEEGLLYSVPRVGTFVGRPAENAREFYLMLLPDDHTSGQEASQGFEERIAERGGACLVMPLAAALGALERAELPPLSGVFDFACYPDEPIRWPHQTPIPIVTFAGGAPMGSLCDEVSHDSEGGGALATRHLLEVGHRRIAFLGLHGDEKSVGELVWSRERAQGWKRALETAGERADALLLPTQPAQERDGALALSATAQEASRQLLQFPDVTAVVAANDHAAQGLFAYLMKANVPQNCWPATVGFDNLPGAGGHLLTSLRLQGQELGRAAADLLWERRHGEASEERVQRLVPMRLIPRLTSRANWSSAGRTELVASLETRSLLAT